MANEENLKPFKKGQSGNPKGRPRKLISQTIKELEEDGVFETTKTEIKGVYLRLINLPMDDLKDRINDKAQPALIRIVGKSILGRKGFDVIEKILDRSIGKPIQTIEQILDADIKINAIFSKDIMNVPADDSAKENS